MPIQDDSVSTTSLLLLRPLIAAVGAADTAIATQIAGLPVPCIWCPTISIVMCATPIQSDRIFRLRMIAAACELDLDILLVRHGLHPEMFDDVAIDAALRRQAPLDVFRGMVAYRAVRGALWLVPPAGTPGPSIRLDTTGLTVSARAPYRDGYERADGVSRAAAETVRLLRRKGRP